MTYPANPTGTNQWGPWKLPEGPGTPPATGLLSVPQSPSGSVTNQSSMWENANGQLAAVAYTTQLVDAAQDGTAFNNQPAVTPGTAPNGPSVGVKEDPAPNLVVPSGTNAMQGATYISNAKAIRLSFGGINPAAIQYFSGINGPTNG